MAIILTPGVDKCEYAGKLINDIKKILESNNVEESKTEAIEQKIQQITQLAFEAGTTQHNNNEETK